MNNPGSGKLIVIDGTDGSGKATQTNLLVERLINDGFRVKKADFPQYGKKSAGLIEEYLNGKYGSAKEVGPYRASIFYAADRYDASFKIRRWLEQGVIVISNRYVTSNLAHQGGKISNPLERRGFFAWLDNLEYDLFKIPRPDLNIILHLDAAMAQQLVDQKGERDYLGGSKRDLHEADLEHLKQAEKIYLDIARDFPGCCLIDCIKDNQLMSRAEIHELIWRRVYQLIIEPAPEQTRAEPYLTNPALEQPTTVYPSNSRHTILTDSAEPKNLSQSTKQINSEPASGPGLKLKVERLSPTAKLPTRAYQHDAGLDLFSSDYYSLFPGDRAIIKTGIKLALPPGYAALIWDKGGLARSGLHTIAGVIDAGFRGELTVNLVNLSQDIYHIAPGQKIAQMLLQKIETPDIVETQLDDTTDRDQGRFGSSGLF